MRRLIEKEELNDRKPSSLLRHLQTLAGASVCEKMLKTIWMNRLPVQIQGHLLSQPDTSSFQELGDLADKLHELKQPAAWHACATSQQNKPGCSSEDMAFLHQKVDELTRVVAGLTNAPRHRRARSRSGSRPRNNKLCWYHDRFGSSAKKCCQPCSWTQTSLSNQENFSSSQ